MGLLLRAMGQVVGTGLKATHTLVDRAAPMLPGAAGSAVEVVSDAFLHEGPLKVAELLAPVPVIGSAAEGVTSAFPRQVIDSLALKPKLFAFFTAPVGIIAGDMKDQVVGLGKLAAGQRLPIMRAWSSAERSARYPLRYREVYEELHRVAPHWEAALKEEGLPLFAPTANLIKAAEATQRASPMTVFQLLDASPGRDPDPRALEAAIAKDSTRLAGLPAAASAFEREWAASQRLEQRVGEQIVAATSGAPSFLLQALATTDEIEGYIRMFEALAPGAVAPLPPAAFRLLVYISSANTHSPTDGAKTPFTPEQLAQAHALLDELIESVLGRAAAEKFPGHSTNLHGEHATVEWLHAASKKPAGTATGE